MSELLRQFETLAEPVTSPSGRWALCYDVDGRAVIRDQDGTTTWAAGAAGAFRLELEGALVVYDGNQIVWRSDFPNLGNTSFGVTDDGDGVMRNLIGLPSYSLRHGPIEPVSLGDRAPAAEIGGNRFLESANGKRTVTRAPDGAGLVYRRKLGLAVAGERVVPPARARLLEQPDTWLTWRFLDEDGPGDWALVLVDHEDEIRWIFGRDHAAKPRPEPVADSPVADSPVATTKGEQVGPGDSSQAWMDTGLAMGGVYCVTAIHNVHPDEALRRFGAEDGQISSSTWAELLRRASYEDVDPADHVVAAFGLGPHTLLVEDNGAAGANRPDLSRGTFVVSSYRSVNADQTFLVSRDGETVARFDENLPSWAEGTDPDVLMDALSEMGIDDPEAFDGDDDNVLDDLELLCRVAGIHPAVEDVTGPSRVAILPMRYPPRF